MTHRALCCCLLPACCGLLSFTGCGGIEQDGPLTLQPHTTTATGLVTLLAQEEEIGAPGVFYMDPEFNRETFEVAFYVGSNKLYLGQINPANGHFVDHDYSFISDATPIITTLNGAEWGRSQNGDALYFTKTDSTNRFHTFRYRDGHLDQLDAGDFFTVSPYPTTQANDAASLVMCADFSPWFLIQRRKPWVIYAEDQPDNPKQFTMATIGKGPRFVPGRRQVTLNVWDRQERAQAALYDFDQDRTYQLTNDSDDKQSVVMFAAPELDGELLLLTQVNQGESLRIYRKAKNQSWQPYKELPAPSGTLFQNNQFFSFEGKTYFTVNIKDETANNNDIYLLSLDGSVYKKVSGSQKMKRFDPEALVSGDHVYIYYYDLESGRLFLSDLLI